MSQKPSMRRTTPVLFTVYRPPTDWADVDRKTRRSIHKSWPTSSLAAHLWETMTGKEIDR